MADDNPRKNRTATNDIKRGLDDIRTAFANIKAKMQAGKKPKKEKSKPSSASKLSKLFRIVKKDKGKHKAPLNVQTATGASADEAAVVLVVSNEYAVSPVNTNETHYAKSIVNQSTNAVVVSSPLPANHHIQPICLDGKISGIEELGTGNFGTVYKTTLVSNDAELQNFCVNNKQNLCLKVLKNGSNQQELMHEAHIGHVLYEHYKAKKKQDASFVPGFNISTLGKINNTLTIVGRYACHGSIDKYIAAYNQRSPIARVTQKKVVTWMGQALHGLKNLHEANVVHGDIGCRNLLLGEQGIEIADFGKSDVLRPNASTIAECSELKAIRWCDRERLVNNSISKFSDIFSMKVTFIEMIAKLSGIQLWNLIPAAKISDIGQLIVERGNAAYLNELVVSLHNMLTRHKNTEMLSVVDAFYKCLTLSPSQTNNDHMAQFIADYHEGVARLNQTATHHNDVSHQMRTTQ